MIVQRPRAHLTKRERQIARLSREIRWIGVSGQGADKYYGLVGSAAESAFRERAELKHNAQVVRAGWPDFLLKSDNGAVFAVEVKSEDDLLSRSQFECFAMLEDGGIPVFVWWTMSPTQLRPWRKFYQRNPLLRGESAPPMTPQRKAQEREAQIDEALRSVSHVRATPSARPDPGSTMNVPGVMTPLSRRK